MVGLISTPTCLQKIATSGLISETRFRFRTRASMLFILTTFSNTFRTIGCQVISVRFFVALNPVAFSASEDRMAMKQSKNFKKEIAIGLAIFPTNARAWAAVFLTSFFVGENIWPYSHFPG